MLQTELDQIRAEKNKLGKEIRNLSEEERDARIAALKSLDVKGDALEEESTKVESEFVDLMCRLPNLPDVDVPVGDVSANKVIRIVGKPTRFKFEPADYMTLSHEMDIVDTETAAKVSGTRFGYLKGAAALLEFALVQHTFHTLTNPAILKKITKSLNYDIDPKPFVPVVPPVMIRQGPYWKMARLDLDQKDDRYYLPNDELYLVGSAEHTLGPMHMDEVFNERELPKRYLGFSSSFRRESGSYGKDTKGILRVHQFDKIEMEVFCSPERSREEFEFIVAIQEYLVKSLELPYQVVLIASGDMGWPDARQYDVEIFLPGENKYRETHTADFMSDYQSRRLNTRVRRGGGTLDFVHMIDATAFAIGRTLIAIIENYQQKDGSIKVPKALRPFMPFNSIRGPHGLAELK